ncbi:polysaccharide deacetylase family protein [Sphingomonas sp. CCH5-D11]|uniref:polysaccharide deacetylase family protein n=1 Tax=Sphingomonas sp. CCH5-D11 TaxID=1768786 RepID=UPI00082CC86A|nr:polysaccharide deacetylase family protein [Sphingomonas sp. CCH5-D11]
MRVGGAAGWRMPPPAPDQQIRWPATFGKRFIVFVDTEEEFDWGAPFSREGRSVQAIAALPDMHRRFGSRGVYPCYLCDHPVAADACAAEILRTLIADGRSAIGAQLHPWVNPPHDEKISARLSFAGNLPPALESAKLDVLTRTIVEAFGQAPLAFRAGRYGLGPHTLELLASRGFRLDTSVRSHHDYSAQGGPDFSAIGPGAFRCATSKPLIELPLTTVYTGALRAAGRRWQRVADHVPRGPGLLARTRLLSRVPLTPEGVSIGEACAAVRMAARDDLRLLTLSFHSPSLVPGHTPYVRDANDLSRFWTWWEVMFEELDRLGYAPATLAEVLQAAG